MKPRIIFINEKNGKVGMTCNMSNRIRELETELRNYENKGDDD